VRTISCRIAVERSGALVWKTAYRILGSGEDAADCLRQAFIKVLRAAKKQPVRNIETAPALTAVTLALEKIRERIHHGDTSTDPLDFEVLTSGANGPDDILQREELANGLRRGLAELTVHEAEVFCLSVFSGISLRRIGRLLEIKPGTARVLLKRATGKLETLLPQFKDPQKNNLQKAIEIILSETAHSAPPRELLNNTVGLLEEQCDEGDGFRAARPSVWEIINSAGPVAKTAVIIAFIAAFVIGYRGYRPPVEELPIVTGDVQQEIGEEIEVGEEIEDIETQPQELPTQKIRRLFDSEDFEGLLELAEAGTLDEQRGLATYLANIGDERAFILLSLLARIHEDQAENPFAQRLEEFETPIDIIEQITEAEQAAAEPDEEEPTAIEPADAEEQVYPLSGLVTDTFGQSVSGVEISIAGPNEAITVFSDDNGFYSVEEGDFEPGMYRIDRAMSLGYVYAGESPELELAPDIEQAYDIEVEPACMIDIAIVDEDGEAAGHVSYYVFRNTDNDEPFEAVAYISESQLSQGDELIAIGGLIPESRPYRIYVIHRDYAPKYFDITLNNPDIVEYREIVLSEGYELEGYLSDINDQPADGVRIHAIAQDWPRQIDLERAAETDQDGYFMISNLQEGLHSIVAEIVTDGQVGQEEVAVVEVPLDEFADITLP